MDFLRKGAQAASKLGNKILEAVEDQNNFGGSSPAGSGHDLEVDLGVRRAKVLTASLKAMGGRAHAWVQALKQNGAEAVSCAQAALEGTKDEFGDDSTWAQSTECLHQVLMEVDSKFTAQLCMLIQRDIIDPIAKELELNGQVKTAIDEIRQGIHAGSDKLDSILTRRRALLASVATALVGHQTNYNSRIGVMFAPLQAHMQANKVALQSVGSSAVPTGRPVDKQRSEYSDACTAAISPARKPEDSPSVTTGSPARASPKLQESVMIKSAPPSAPAPQQPPSQPAAAPQAQEATTPKASKPTPVVVDDKSISHAEADLLRLNSASPPCQAAAAKSAEADLLGSWDDSPQQVREKGVPVVNKNGNKGDLIDGFGDSPKAKAAKSDEGDLLGGLWEAAPASTAAKKSAPASSSKQQPVDIFSNLGGSRTSSTPSNSNGASSDPFGDWMGGGTSANRTPAAPQKQDSLMALFGDSSGGGKNTDVQAVHGDDSESSQSGTSPARAPAKRREVQSTFSGTGTDREALKQQFEDHVQKKAQEAADLVRQQEADKQRYDDMKFKLQDQVDARIIAWAGPKHNRKNLRAMLSTFQSVIHEEAKEKWKPVGLHEVVTPDQVKKIHRKAILLVHPDKVQRASLESKLIAEYVHSVLHEALDIFRKQEQC